MLNEREMEQLFKIKDTMIKNDLFLRICVTYLNECEKLVTRDLINEITGTDKALEAYAFSSFLSSAFIENEELEKELKRDYFNQSIKKLDAEEYRLNPYFKNIKIEEKVIGGWKLSHQKYDA